MEKINCDDVLVRNIIEYNDVERDLCKTTNALTKKRYNKKKKLCHCCAYSKESKFLANHLLSDVGMDFYNYTPDDKFLNKCLYLQLYEHIGLNLEKEYEQIKVPTKHRKNFISNIGYDTMEPSSVINDGNNVTLHFKYKGEQHIACNTLRQKNKKISATSIIEMINITKETYAYCTLFFPAYNEDLTEIKYTYLPPTLLVAFLLKMRKQNYMNDQAGILGTKARVICMVTPDVDDTAIELLLQYYDEVKVVPYIAWDNVHLPNSIKNDPSKFIRIGDVSVGKISKTHSYNKVFTKMHIFDKSKFPYKKVILLDTDLFPMCYFDSLFSLSTPAGWLEHRRGSEKIASVDSWRFDRCDFVSNRNGGAIPKFLTDIETPAASDINASLYVIEPDEKEFYDMLEDLQQHRVNSWFRTDSEVHKGSWLGGILLKFYLLPEQNYFTKRFSGKWSSIDMSFSTWLIDTHKCFGFTFAGWIVKPWLQQSMGHTYSKNLNSLWSKTHNTYTQKSYGMQLLNNLFSQLLSDLFLHNKLKYACLATLIKQELFFTDGPFDPWIPEYDIQRNKITIQNIQVPTYKCLTYDQKKFIHCCNLDDTNKAALPFIDRAIYIDYITTNVTAHLFPVVYYSIGYILLCALDRALSGTGIRCMGMGKTFVSAHLFHSFNYFDDDNDIIAINPQMKQNEFYFFLIRKLLNYKFSVKAFLRKKTSTEQLLINFTMVDIFQNKNVIGAYCNKNKPNPCVSLEELVRLTQNTYDIMYVNFSIFYMETLEYYKMYYEKEKFPDKIYQENGFIKNPWIDIFYGKIDKGYLDIVSIGKDNLYVGDLAAVKLYDVDLYQPVNAQQYLESYYSKNFVPNHKYTLKTYIASKYLDNFIIRETHGKNKNAELFKINLGNAFQRNTFVVINDLMTKQVLNYVEFLPEYNYIVRTRTQANTNTPNRIAALRYMWWIAMAILKGLILIAMTMLQSIYIILIYVYNRLRNFFIKN